MTCFGNPLAAEHLDALNRIKELEKLFGEFQALNESATLKKTRELHGLEKREHLQKIRMLEEKNADLLEHIHRLEIDLAPAASYEAAMERIQQLEEQNRVLRIAHE